MAKEQHCFEVAFDTPHGRLIFATHADNKEQAIELCKKDMVRLSKDVETTIYIENDTESFSWEKQCKIVVANVSLNPKSMLSLT